MALTVETAIATTMSHAIHLPSFVLTASIARLIASKVRKVIPPDTEIGSRPFQPVQSLPFGHHRQLNRPIKSQGDTTPPRVDA